MHAYGSKRAYVDNFRIEENICYNKGPFLIGGGRPSKNIRVFKNFLYGIDMRIGYNAPYNENCEIRDNTIVNGVLNIDRYKQVVKEDNLVIRKGQKRPVGVKTVLLPNRFDRNRAHLVVYNWDKSENVKVRANPFLNDRDSYCLMDPQNFFGNSIFNGKYYGDVIQIPMKTEFSVFVVVRNN
jgi:hypothetical protein